MASPLRYTLVTDGSSDRALLPIINWVLQSIPASGERGFIGQWADLRNVQRTAAGLRGRIVEALRLYPCDILFVHRDAEASEREVRQQRCQEIQTAMEGHPIPYVSLVPVRMTEAWLLIDAAAICRAADNPNSRARIALLALRRLEQESDPKALLHTFLIEASEKRGRRRDQFRRELPWRCARVAELITDFSPLQQLQAFAEFAEQTRQILQSLPGNE
ncbi:MAG: hypothetical protein HYS12_16800 [Planctomycetes bacterium]|nr:hypothetical protein [Planctomycetota bacterium]